MTTLNDEAVEPIQRGLAKSISRDLAGQVGLTETQVDKLRPLLEAYIKAGFDQEVALSEFKAGRPRTLEEFKVEPHRQRAFWRTAYQLNEATDRVVRSLDAILYFFKRNGIT